MITIMFRAFHIRIFFLNKSPQTKFVFRIKKSALSVFANKPQLSLKQLRDLFNIHAVSYLGLSQSRVRNLTPPPQVREHCPNSLHEPQFPSCFMMSGVNQMQ